MGRSGKLAARFARVGDVDAQTVDAMWAVFARHYEGSSRTTFERDLARKRDVILACDTGDGSVQGFSTLDWGRATHEGRAFVWLFSGDTIAAPEYWGQRAIQNAFGAYGLRLKLRNPTTPTYWFLVSKGYKTYLLLSRNFPEHWPRHDRPTPAWQRGVLGRLARDRFGASWREAEGIVAGEGKDRLRAGVAPIDEALLEAEDVRFFHAANPGHARGDELACLGRISFGLWPRYLVKNARRRAARLARRRSWAPS